MNLQTPVGSFGSALGAVQAGADELLLCNWDAEPGKGVSDVITYCRRRSVKTVLNLSGRFSDKQIAESSALLRVLYSRGLDAVLASDPGVMRMVRMAAPEAELHISGGIRSANAVLYAASFGARRVVLPPGLPSDGVRSIARGASVEIQLGVYGHACPNSGGLPCYLAGQDGAQCGLQCRQKYGYGGKADGTPLKPAQVDRLHELDDLREMNVTTVSVLSNNDVFLPDNGVLLDSRSVSRADSDRIRTVKRLLAGDAAPERARGEIQRVPVRFYCLIERGEAVRLAVNDDRGNTEVVSGPFPVPSGTELLEAEVNTQLYKTAGTPYLCVEARTRLRPGLNIPLAELKKMKAALLTRLDAVRTEPPKRTAGQYHPGVTLLPRGEKPVITVQLSGARQLSEELYAMKPACVYLPLEEICAFPEKAEQLRRASIPAVAVLPRSISDAAAQEVLDRLRDVRGCGVSQALVYHPGDAALALAAGMAVRGDFYCTNSQALKEYRQKGFLSVMLSMGLGAADIRDMSLNMDTELMLYGRVPQLLSETCLIRTPEGLCRCDGTVELVDASGRRHPAVRESGHMTLLLSSEKLWMAPHRRVWETLGLWAGRLVFTTENNREVIQVTERFMGTGKYQPNQITTGHYISDNTPQKRPPAKLF